MVATSGPDAQRTQGRSVWMALLGERFVARPCPVCAVQRAQLLFVGDRHNMGLRNVICRGCGHIYINPAPDAAWLDRFYTHVYRLLYNEAAEPTDQYLQTHDSVRLGIRDCMAWLHEQVSLSAGQTVLDIGCAEGAYLQEIERLAAVHLIGFEPSLAFASFARTQVPEAVIFASTFSPAALEGRTVDAVIAAHVLEHILEPMTFLKQIKTVLKPDGVLYLEAPVGDRRHVKNIFHVAHLNNFTRSSLPWLLRRAGFRIHHLDQKGTRGGAEGAYRLLARQATKHEASAPDDLATLAQAVLHDQHKQFLRYRMKNLPRRLGKMVAGRRPQSLL